MSNSTARQLPTPDPRASEALAWARASLDRRNALRYTAGLAGLFAPDQSMIDQLLAHGLIEEVDPRAWRVADRYRPTTLTTEHVLPRIGARG